MLLFPLPTSPRQLNSQQLSRLIQPMPNLLRPNPSKFPGIRQLIENSRHPI